MQQTNKRQTHLPYLHLETSTVHNYCLMTIKIETINNQRVTELVMRML